MDFLLGAVVTGALVVVLYGAYLLNKDRHEYRKKHGIDPWRHGWDHPDKKE